MSGISQETAMDHNEAKQTMAAERYLLDELTPEEREAFEQHVFDCPDCAFDLRAGSAFITEARAQLPELATQSYAPVPQPKALPARKPRWSSWLQPAFAVPVFAVLLALIAYQNISVIPGLKRAAEEPRIVHSTAIHLGTRGSAHTVVSADRTEGLALSIELPQTSGYSSFVFDLYDSHGKQVWTHAVTASAADSADDSIVSFVIPGSGLLENSYTLEVSGSTPQNNRVEIDRRVLDVQVNH
jgi:anti-sigma factor RsiW